MKVNISSIMGQHAYVAIDLGAESGRAILGSLRSDKLHIEEKARFANETQKIDGHYHWDIDGLFSNIKSGMRSCTQAEIRPESVAVDTWGVDFGLLGGDGALLDRPYSYRDHRTDGMMERFFDIVPRRRVYDLTGIQFMQLNSLFQLYASVLEDPGLFKRATRLLFMPDIFNYLLTGETKSEFTIATTSQLFNPRTADWDTELLSALGVPRSVMQDIVQPGTPLGSLKHSVAKETHLEGIGVTAVASHDTGSAIAAIPAQGDDWAYISSGTWSLMGVEIGVPIITDDALNANFTNEGGVEGTFRFLKNIMGLWLLQQCRKEWSSSAQYSYDDLMRLTDDAKPFRSVIDPDYSDFFNPPSMQESIRVYCDKTGQLAPEKPAEFVRCILESLALKYRVTLDQLRQLTGRRIARVHIIGGGSQNRLLCQYAANAMGVPVIAGPVEATAIGNIMMQAHALGHVGSLAEIRTIVGHSFQPMRHEPKDQDVWNSAYERFSTLTSMNQ
ncbi:MAG: rhamnulokinase [Ignavibacteriales bacterium]|nr:rhamnulokinase [Ignavibacteriales bacterium]